MVDIPGKAGWATLCCPPPTPTKQCPTTPLSTRLYSSLHHSAPQCSPLTSLISSPCPLSLHSFPPHHHSTPSISTYYYPHHQLTPHISTCYRLHHHPAPSISTYSRPTITLHHTSPHIPAPPSLCPSQTRSIHSRLYPITLTAGQSSECLPDTLKSYRKSKNRFQTHNYWTRWLQTHGSLNLGGCKVRRIATESRDAGHSALPRASP